MSANFFLMNAYLSSSLICTLSGTYPSFKLNFEHLCNRDLSENLRSQYFNFCMGFVSALNSALVIEASDFLAVLDELERVFSGELAQVAS